MTSISAILAILFSVPVPASVSSEAALPLAEPDVRFVSMHADSPSAFSLVPFALNSVSPARAVIQPGYHHPVFAVRLSDFGISAAAWEDVFGSSPDPVFYHRGVPRDFGTAHLQTRTTSRYPIVTAGHFLAMTLSNHRHYARLLPIPPKPFLSEPRLAASTPSHLVYRRPTAAGYLWQTAPSASTDIIESLLNPPRQPIQVIWNLRNGHAVFLGQLDPTISHYDVSVGAPASCMACHTRGPLRPSCSVRALLGTKRANIFSATEDGARRLSTALADLDPAILADQKATVTIPTGLLPYLRARLVVSPYQAMREFPGNRDTESFVSVSLLVGRSVRRDLWNEFLSRH